MLYQYGRDSTGRDTFGPGTAEDGTPLGNQDGTMIGSQDARYNAAQSALSQYGPNYTQLRVAQQGVPGGFRDRSLVRYDPTVGYVTPVSNIVAEPDDTNARMMMVLAPALAGMAMGAYTGAGLGGGAADAAGTAGAATAGDESAGLNMTSPFASDVGAPGYANEIGAATQAGAPVTDLGVPASQQSVWSQMLNNLQNGRGLLGMSPAQRAGTSVLAQMLTRRPPSGGGGK
jgi:hypothetical protein